MDGDPAMAAIAAAGVSKRYGSIEALTDVTVAIDGLATGLLGANGAGKSTLMRALLGLVRPDAGTLNILGLDAARDGRDIRRRVGYMPEGECLPRDPSAHVFVVHLAELRGLPRRAAVLRASEVLFQVGLEEERSRPIGTFSTGKRQRVKLAQALVHGPELVVLDEPTAGLDPAGREEMLQLVRRLSLDLGVRVLLSSHVLERLRELHALAHAGRERADRPRALLLQADLEQHLAGAQHRRPVRQAPQLGQVHDEHVRRGVTR